MKYIKLFFAALIIFSLTAFNQNVLAQVIKKKPKLINKAEYDKREIKRFIASFIKTLDETKDLNEISSNFFAKDFKTLQTQFPYDFNDYADVLRQLSVDEQFEHQMSFFNLCYLEMMWSGGSENFVFEDKDDNDDNDEEDNDDIKKLFPPDVVEVLKTNRLLSKMFEIDDNVEDTEKPIQAPDLIEITATLQNATRLLKIDLENKNPNWKEIYVKNIKSARKQFADYGTESCQDERCIGLPTKTQVFWQAAFPFCLHLYRKDGKLKIFYIHIYTND